MNRRTILVAEDDPHIREGLVTALTSEGYGVEEAIDGRAALAAFQRQRPDLVLLDIMMPEVSGYDVCRAIRRADVRTPVIMLTAKGEEVNRVVGLELGADDYIAKPFGVRELLARIAAVLRRSCAAAESGPADELPERFVFGAAQVNRGRYTATCQGQTRPLTARELKLVEIFAANPGRVLSRDDLLNRAWGVRYLGTTRTLDQHIAQLRKKVEARPEEPTAIVTVHGVGYRYDTRATTR